MKQSKKNPNVTKQNLDERLKKNNKIVNEPIQIKVEPIEKEPTIVPLYGHYLEKKEKSNLKEEIKSICQEQVDIYELVIDRIGDSKTHGVSNIVKAKSNILRVIWIVCFLVSVA